MTKEEAKASLVTGGIYESPYSGKRFKLVEGWAFNSDYSVRGVAEMDDRGEFRKNTGLHPYWWYDGKPVIRIDSQQQTMEFGSEQKQLPIFN